MNDPHPHDGTPRVAAVVLAAGGGSRFAGPTHKLLARLRGRAVAAWAIEAACGAGMAETIVVTGPVDLGDAVPEGVTVLVNPDWAAGQAGSLQVALRHAEAAGYDAVVVGLADQPFVPSATWRAVADAPGALVSAVLEGERRPPVRIPRELWPLLPTTGDEGARALMRGRPDLVSEIACPGQPSDIDTVEDLETWN